MQNSSHASSFPRTLIARGLLLLLIAAGVGLFVWGEVELFIVDKTLRPRLVGGPVKLPFLPTFFGLVGGVKTMGFVGLFVGPMQMALLVAIWREWLLGIRLANVAAAAKQNGDRLAPRNRGLSAKKSRVKRPGFLMDKALLRAPRWRSPPASSARREPV